MTGIERTTNALNHRRNDQLASHETFWSNTVSDWKKQGKAPADMDLETHFQFDMRGEWPFNYVADLDYVPEIVEETDTVVLTRDGNGALLRKLKDGTGTPEHVDYLVKDREAWEEHIKPKLTPDPRRINFEAYRFVKNKSAEQNAFFWASGVNVFEAIHPMCGHENLLVGMALDPDWVLDMVETYSGLMVELQQILFAKEGKPDGFWYYEDMGYKGTPFMSPAMYKELIFPGHKKTIDYNKSENLYVTMHSCGFVEPLLPHVIEAGIDCLQAMEVKAGMDLIRIHKNYGEKITLMGGLDARAIASNDKTQVDKELEKLNMLSSTDGYILHSDHSIPPGTDYENYKYFLEKGRTYIR